MPCIVSALSCAYAATSAVTAAMESENDNSIVTYSSGGVITVPHTKALSKNLRHKAQEPDPHPLPEAAGYLDRPIAAPDNEQEQEGRKEAQPQPSQKQEQPGRQEERSPRSSRHSTTGAAGPRASSIPSGCGRWPTRRARSWAYRRASTTGASRPYWLPSSSRRRICPTGDWSSTLRSTPETWSGGDVQAIQQGAVPASGVEDQAQGA